MFRRLRWMLIGSGLGLAFYFWATGKARQAKAAVPEAGQDLMRQALGSVRELGDRLAEAVREGREAMSEKDVELRRELLGDGEGSRSRA